MLQIIDIEKSYKKFKVLKGVNLSVKKGEIKALIGENGAGKSTIVDIICGVKSKDSGTLKINGIDLSNKKDFKKNKYIMGYMPQTFTMYNDLTVKENLEYVACVYGIKNYDQTINNILKLCFLEEKQDFLAQNLSGGYRQLLSLACSIIHNPKLLILDEPTGAMDPIFRKRFWASLKDLRQNGTTIFLITHYLEELLECDSFACLSGGKIVFDGSVKEFKKNNFINIEEILTKFKEV